jgi:hypothetical protein
MENLVFAENQSKRQDLSIQERVLALASAASGG